MLISPWPEGRDALLQALNNEYQLSQPRSGMHLSDLTQCLTLSYLRRTDPQPLTDQQVRYFSVGWALERVLISRLHVEPLELDGITATPDFELMGVPSELKSTAMSEDGKSLGCAECGLAKTGHTKALAGHAYVPGPKSGFQIPASWLMRIKGYRWMLNELAPFCECGHSRKLHFWEADGGYGWCLLESTNEDGEHGLCGCNDYKEKPLWGGGVGGGVAPRLNFGLAVLHLISRELVVKMLWFSLAELEENWATLLERANVLENLLAVDDGGEPFQHKVYEQECDNCSYSLTCQLRASLDAATSHALS